MNLDELLKKYIKDENNNLLPYGYFAFQTLTNNIVNKLEKAGFLQGYYFTDELKKLNIQVGEKYQMSYFNKNGLLYHVSLSSFSNMIEGAKTMMIDLLQDYITLTKNILALNLISGKEVIEDEEKESYILGTYSIEDGFIEVGKVQFFKKDNAYLVYSELSSRVIECSNNFNRDEKGLIFSSASALNQIGIVPLKMNEANVLHTCRELKEALIKEGYRVSLNEDKISEKDKLDDYISLGTPLIMEIGPRDILNKKIEVIKRTDLITLNVDEDRLVNYLPNFFKKINVDLINRQIKLDLLNSVNISSIEELKKCENKKKNIVWDGEISTLDKLKKACPNSIFFLPFNQELFLEEDLFSLKKGKYVLTICPNLGK